MTNFSDLLSLHRTLDGVTSEPERAELFAKLELRPEPFESGLKVSSTFAMEPV